MGVIIFMVIVYCIFYAIPKSLYREELKRSNDPLAAIFAVIIPIVLCVIFAVCYNMENQQLGAYILLSVGTVMLMLIIYAHWHKWKEKQDKKHLERNFKSLTPDQEKYREELRASAKRRLEAKKSAYGSQ